MGTGGKRPAPCWCSIPGLADWGGVASSHQVIIKPVLLFTPAKYGWQPCGGLLSHTSKMAAAEFYQSQK